MPVNLSAYTVETAFSEAYLKDYIEEWAVEIANYIIEKKRQHGRQRKNS